MHVFFDLDGTLTDSSPGIVRCFQHALTELGRHPPSEPELRELVGPPLAAGFARLLETSDPAQIERGVAAYRRRFEEVGMFENALYPGIPHLLAGLAAGGHELYVVTSKPAVYAGRILRHFGLEARFRAVYGPTLADRHFDKGVLLRAALDRHGAPLSASVMVGDRADDMAAARDCAVVGVGAGWGYGSRTELQAAGARCIVGSAAELAECLEELR